MSKFHTKNQMFISNVALLVKDLNESKDFYQNVLKMSVKNETQDSLDLYAGPTKLITLIGNSNASRVQTLGLYHFALLLPSFADLAHIVKHFIDVKYPLTGASDHGVSQALYLNDPDGNGIEIYADRKKEDWPLEGGKTSMYTDHLNFNELMKLLPNEPYEQMPEKTVMGHLHFHVNTINDGKKFFVDVLGYDVIISYGRDSALFLSDQEYHHHVGLNIWSQATSFRQQNQTGLMGYTLLVPPLYKESLLTRLKENNFELTNNQFTDPLNQKVTLEFT